MKNRTFLIYHPSQLNTLSTLPWNRKAGLARIVFDDSFVHPDKLRMQEEINKSYRACGCDTGAKAMLLGILGGVVAAVVGYIQFDWSVAYGLAIVLITALSMAVMGKFYGLVAANRKLQSVIIEVQRVWKPKWPQSKMVGCG